ncbi:ribosomal RNA small subunit methyltransferase H-like [Zingiber officinale]|uniref:ribosomal RNA small subunit methyltransferase H-like n=1 Tax=Zingiber officinale TaxID=94328 RepID=UPI001C4C3E15|nr:ribosomal RNA small subunit methyltransferase H-like [Zingiber officinale]
MAALTLFWQAKGELYKELQKSKCFSERRTATASLTAEEILNSWPAAEVGKVLREYGEESNWQFIQNQIVEARAQGGLHTTDELVHLIYTFQLICYSKSQPATQTPYQPAPVVQPSSAFSFSNFRQIQPASSSGFGAMPNIFSQSSIGHAVTYTIRDLVLL